MDEREGEHPMIMTPITRPTSLAEWFERSQQTWLPLMRESTQHGVSYQAQPTDLFISPFAKCGTTWLQQIVHGLRTGGAMDFDDISRVVPWLETAHMLGLDLQAPQPGASRLSRATSVGMRSPKEAATSSPCATPKMRLFPCITFLTAGCGRLGRSRWRNLLVQNWLAHSIWRTEGLAAIGIIWPLGGNNGITRMCY